MNKKIQSIRGMNDYLSDSIYVWQHIEETFKLILNSYGYREIRLPILEKTVLFQRTIGAITDIVEKEMFTFLDRSNESVSLRPEGTAGCVRAMIENALLYQKIQKIWYMGPMFRYERPQKGRYRQFYQLGVEVFGLDDPEIDAELILMTSRFFKTLGLDQYITLELNSIGSKETRLNYCDALVSFLEMNKKFLDKDCLRRLEKNPLRILDSKNTNVRKLLENAPIFFNFLDLNSKKKLKKLCDILDKCQLSYHMNAHLVRGLDYYNSTVFEWTTNELGAQKSICAGGRYDNLVKELGGDSIPAIGFAIGLERLVLLMKKFYPDLRKKNTYIYIIEAHNEKDESIILSEKIRNYFPQVICTIEKKLKNLNLNKINTYIALLPEKKEIKKKLVIIKNLQNGEKKITTKDNIINHLKLFL